MDLTAALHAYEKAVLASRPVAWWRLGENAGPAAFDAMQKHDGTYHGNVIFGRTGAVKHDPNTAVELPGTAYAEVPDSTAFSQPTSGQGLSVEAWMRPGNDLVPGHGTAPVRLGTRDLASYLHGGLDEVAICPRVLSANEVMAHYNAAQ